MADTSLQAGLRDKAGPPADHAPADPAVSPPCQESTAPAAGTEPGSRRPLSLRESFDAVSAHLRPHRAGASLACSLLVVSGAVALAQPLVVRDLLSAFAVGRDWQRQAWELVGLVLLDAVVVAFGNYLLMRAAEGVVLHARRALVAHVLRLPMVEVHRQTPGDLMARVAGDTMLLRQVVTQTLVQALTGFVTVIGTLIMMGIVDPTLLVVTLGVLLLLGLVVGVLMPRIRRAALSAQDAVGSMGAALERALTSFTTVKASGTEELEAGRVGDSAKAAYNQGISLAWSTSVAGTSAGLAMQVAFLTVLGVGGARVADGAISLATLIAFLLYVMYLAQPVLSLVNVGTYFQAARAALQRIAEVQRLPVEPLDEPETDSPAVAPRRAAASVRFDNVTFTYPGRKDPAVDSFSLTVPARGLTAMVGPSGAGKTTLLSLVERFWDPDRGRVLLDGTDLRQWNLRDLRAGIGYVEQDAPVIAGTLRENLTYTAPAADEALLWEVLRTTRLEALVERLDGDLDAPLPRGGASLSGGERQRIAIARALLRRPRLLILDEATSQLDAVNEAALREAVDEVARTTTVLVVAHRLSTVLSADLIAVVDQGGLRAVGRHAELLRHDVLYAELAANQLVG